MNSLNIQKRRRRSSLEKTKARAGYVFVLPFLLGIVLIYLPILIDSILFSFGVLTPGFDTETMTPTLDLVFNEKLLEHYQNALFANSSFVQSLLSGLQQLIFEVPAVIIFSLFIAVVLNQKMLGRAAFRAIFFVPVVISTGLIEALNASDIITDATQEGINDGSQSGGSQIISMMDIQTLFADMEIGADLVTYIVNLVNNIYNIINFSGVQMLIFLAGLQSISPSIYEACQIEGATAWETFWKITFPMISPMILVNTVYTIIDSFTKSSNITMSYIASEFGKGMEQATAMAWIYFLIVALIIAVVAGIASSFIFYQRRD